MRVLFITGSYPPMKCGVGAYTQKLAVALADLESVEVTVLTDKRATRLPILDGVNFLPLINSWRFSELFRIAKQVIKLSPDVVHIQYHTQGYVGKVPMLVPLIISLLGKCCIQTWHEPVFGAGVLRLSYGLDALITVREELLETLPRWTQIFIHKTPFFWISAASMLPTALLNDDERSKIRNKYVSDNERLLVFYGFIAPLKGLEALFEIVAKVNVQLLIASDFNPQDDYHKSLLELISTMRIATRTKIIGFLSDEDLSRILSAADAVVLPFRDGAKDCNTSVDGAVAQGTFVLTTSLVHSGYKKEKNIYYAKPGNVDEMITSIENFAGHRASPVHVYSEWRKIALKHLEIYKQLTIK